MVLNVMETVVNYIFEEFQKEYRLKCSCEECRNDILALTLNQLPPKYASRPVGEVLIKATYTNPRLKQQVMKELIISSIKVERNPQHS